MAAPGDLRQLATRLRVAAGVLPSALDSVAAHAGSQIWRGPASQRFSSELQDQRRRLRALADELTAAARTCAAEADALDGRPEPAGGRVPAEVLVIELIVDRGEPGTERELEIEIRSRAGQEPSVGAVLEAAGTEGDGDGPVWVGPDAVEVGAPARSVGLGAGVTVCTSAPAADDANAGLAVLALLTGPSAGRCLPLTETVVLGRNRRAGLVVDDPTVSGLHARLVEQGDGTWAISDLHSRNGTRVKGALVQRVAVAAPGDILQFGAMRATIRRSTTADNADVGRPRASGRIPFNRPPRTSPPPPAAAPVELPSLPASVPVSPRFGWAALIAPLAVGLGMALLFGPMMAAFAVFSPVMVLGNWWEDRRRARAALRRNAEAWRAELDRLDARLEHAAESERARRGRAAPDLVEVLRRACLPATSLWQRRGDDPDFGMLGLGLGTVSWHPVASDRSGSPSDGLDATLERHRLLADVPVALRVGPGVVIGIAGDRRRALELGRALIVQAAVHHGPADLGVCVFSPREDVADWEWSKWLPHVRSSAGARRLLATDIDASALVDDLIATATEPRLLLVVADGEAFVVERGAPVRRLVESGRHPVALIVLADTPERLPATCSSVIDMRADGSTECTNVENGSVVDLSLAGLTSELARRSALWLTRFEDPECAAASDPHATTYLGELLDLHPLDARTVAMRWRRQPARSLAVPVGMGPRGPLLLDLVADGPHMLLAGTTGAGKSELLRTVIVSLAATFDPEHLALVLVDFKGGSAFADCASLPHTTGVVTDLDEQLGQRVLRSLDAELRRREHLLSDAEVASIDEYMDAGCDQAQPMPRLVVIIDEFATLAAELPDFIDSLVGVAQRGRSLGVHLVLATQRPSGSIGPAVRANTSIRLALRVEDDADSIDVVGCADAARIGRSTPGRGVARFGPGAIVPFQSALAAAGPHDGTGAVVARPFTFEQAPRPAGSTAADGGLAAIVAAIAAAAALEGSRPIAPPWRPPLPDQLRVEALTDPPEGCAVGLVDDPDHQRQSTLAWSPRTGNVLCYGVSGSGASSTLRTLALAMARRWSPSDLHVYGLDFGTRSLGRLRGLAHVGSIVAASDRERQQRLIRMLRSELERRRAGAGRDGVPLIVLLIDNYAGFHAAFDDLGGLAWREELVRVVADGPAVGIYTVASADRPGAVPPAVADPITTKLVFRLGDPGDVTLFGLRPRGRSHHPPGRAVDVATGLEVQIALAPPDDVVGGADDDRAGAAPPVPVLPAEVLLADVAPASDFSGGDWSVMIGMGDRDMRPAGLRLCEGDCALVAGPPRSGRSTALVNIAGVVRRRAGHVCIAAVALRRSPLRECPVDRVVTDGRALGALLDELEGSEGLQLLLIDDADAVDDPSGRLAHLLGERRANLRVVVAGRSDALRTGYGHWTAVVRRARLGVVLRPHADVDGELWQTALPRHGPATFPVGRGYALDDGRFDLVQLAGPEPRPM